MEPLKEEAAIAKEYKQLSKEMEQSDVIVTVSDIDHYTEDNQRLDERLNHLKSQQAEKEGQQAQINQLLQKYKGKRQQNDYDIEKLNYELVKATENYEQLSGKLNVLEERKKNQSETLEVKTTVDEIKKNPESLNNRADIMEDRISNLEDRNIEMLQVEEERELRL